MLTCAPSDRAASTLAIGAPSGMNTKHGTPRARAAYATAWAWLPALPVITPAAHSSPSIDTFVSAPRILNEPVLCRFSLFSATIPPARSLSVRELSTGVCLTSPAITWAARRTSSAETGALPPVT